jgi:hypothetical protein
LSAEVIATFLTLRGVGDGIAPAAVQKIRAAAARKHAAVVVHDVDVVASSAPPPHHAGGSATREKRRRWEIITRMKWGRMMIEHHGIHWRHRHRRHLWRLFFLLQRHERYAEQGLRFVVDNRRSSSNRWLFLFITLTLFAVVVPVGRRLGVVLVPPAAGRRSPLSWMATRRRGSSPIPGVVATMATPGSGSRSAMAMTMAVIVVVAVLFADFAVLVVAHVHVVVLKKNQDENLIS